VVVVAAKAVAEKAAARCVVVREVEFGNTLMLRRAVREGSEELREGPEELREGPEEL
jgi:hypothetical protein